jgi:SAM-dependent methyltransferase
MSEVDRDKWNERYRAGAYATRTHPSALLVQYARHARPGPALDVACGAGRNALFLAEQGFTVDAVDISDVGLQRLQSTARQRELKVRSHCLDLMDEPELPGEAYNLIVMVRFVAQSLTSRLAEILAPGGLLVVEQHLQFDSTDSSLYADLVGPSSARFRLPPGALRSWIGDATLEILHDYEGTVAEPDGKTALLAQFVGRRISN